MLHILNRGWSWYRILDCMEFSISMKRTFTCDILVHASFPVSVFAFQLLPTGYHLTKLWSFWPVLPPPDHIIFYGGHLAQSRVNSFKLQNIIWALVWDISLAKISDAPVMRCNYKSSCFSATQHSLSSTLSPVEPQHAFGIVSPAFYHFIAFDF